MSKCGGDSLSGDGVPSSLAWLANERMVDIEATLDEQVG